MQEFLIFYIFLNFLMEFMFCKADRHTLLRGWNIEARTYISLEHMQRNPAMHHFFGSNLGLITLGYVFSTILLLHMPNLSYNNFIPIPIFIWNLRVFCNLFAFYHFDRETGFVFRTNATFFMVHTRLGMFYNIYNVG